MLCIRVCVLLYVCSAVYETRTYGAMRGAGGSSPTSTLLYIVYRNLPNLLGDDAENGILHTYWERGGHILLLYIISSKRNPYLWLKNKISTLNNPDNGRILRTVGTNDKCLSSTLQNWRLLSIRPLREKHSSTIASFTKVSIIWQKKILKFLRSKPSFVLIKRKVSSG